MASNKSGTLYIEDGLLSDLSFDNGCVIVRNSGETDLLINFELQVVPEFPMHPDECIIVDGVAGHMTLASLPGETARASYIFISQPNSYHLSAKLV